MNFDNLDQYINLDSISKTDLINLNEIIRKFTLSVPFENINVQNNMQLALNDQSMIRKITVENRGGFCYENNHLFKNYLRSKGFNNYIISGKINTPFGYWSRDGSHMSVITVIKGNKYVTDVGFGDLPMVSIPLTEDKIVEDINGKYKAKYINDKEFDLMKFNEDDEVWEILYRATDIEKNLEDFKDNIEYNRFDPNSIFVKKLIITQIKLYGRVTMTEKNLTITRNKEKTKLGIDKNNYKKYLNEYFNIKGIEINTFK
ncbi:arylamine N-acetyltransferase [Staphylococcus casei]|uniref:Arylamine N-acetyltransferase n=1 Tax=Staphylococcus casei TaxID=201828 RepID=A0ABZ2WAC4_9STAP